VSGEISLAFAPRVHPIDSAKQMDGNPSILAKHANSARLDNPAVTVPFRFRPASNQDELIVAKASVLGRSLPSYSKPPRPPISLASVGPEVVSHLLRRIAEQSPKEIGAKGAQGTQREPVMKAGISSGMAAEVSEEALQVSGRAPQSGALVRAQDLAQAVHSVSKSHEAVEMQALPGRVESAAQLAEADPPVVVLHPPRVVPAGLGTSDVSNVVSNLVAAPVVVGAQAVAPGHRRKPSRVQAAQIDLSINLIAESRLGLKKVGVGRKLWQAVSPYFSSAGHTLALAGKALPKSFKSAFTGGSEYTCGMIDFVHKPMMNLGADHDVLKRRATAEKAIFRASGTAMWVCSALSVVPVVGLGFLAAAGTLALTRALWTGYRTHQVRAEVLKAQQAAPSSGSPQAKINTNPIVKKGAIDMVANAAAPLGALLTSVGALFGPVGVAAAIVVLMVTGLLSTLHKDVSILAQAEIAQAAKRRV